MKITHTETHQQVAKAFVQASGYAEDERVRAIFLIGSSASGEEDTYSDVDMLIAINAPIPDDERLERLRAIGCRNIMLAIAGVDNLAFPVQSQVIDKFVFQDVWFDVSCHLPHQLGFCFDFVTLVDKDNLTPRLCAPDQGQTYSAAELKARAQADLRLLHARVNTYEKYALRGEWIGLDLFAIKNLIVDVAMVLNGQPHYNRHSSHVSQMLHDLSVKPEHFEQNLLNILHWDNRRAWRRKVEMLRHMEEELAALCEAQWGPIAMFDDEDPPASQSDGRA
jgi:hypothetical protein